MSPIVAARELLLRYGTRHVFGDVNLDLDESRFVALIGPNGAGKSSLLRILAGVQRPSSGSVERRERLSLIVAAEKPPADVTPRELAGYGPALQKPWWRFLETERDRLIVDAALGRAGLLDRADDPVADLSGGEVQRAWLAAALALSPRAVLIDEPTTHLDLRYQIEVMHMLREVAASGVAVCAAIHDLTLAARFADTVALLAGGRMAVGPPEQVLEPKTLSSAFGVQVTTHRDPMGGHIVCLAR